MPRYLMSLTPRLLQQSYPPTAATIASTDETFSRTHYYRRHQHSPPTFVSRPISVLGSILSRRMSAVETSRPTPICIAAKAGMGSSEATGWLTQVLATFTISSDGRNIPYTICHECCSTTNRGTWNRLVAVDDHWEFDTRGCIMLLDASIATSPQS